MDKVTSQANISSMLQTLRAYQAEAGGGMSKPRADKTQEAPASSFAGMVQQTLQDVNAKQLNAQAMASAYERGEPVPLTDVVLAMQKSSLSFEATLQVRNKVLKAYEDILNMPV